MKPTQIATLISAGFGVAGTMCLFFGTYGLQPPEGSPFGGPMLDAHNARIAAENKARTLRQRIGLALLMLSFAGQSVAVLLP